MIIIYGLLFLLFIMGTWFTVAQMAALKSSVNGDFHRRIQPEEAATEDDSNGH